MRVIGIDPGTATVGWAVVEEIEGAQTAIAYGHITTLTKESTASRLKEIADDLEQIIKKHQPAEAAVEELFFAQNVTTAMKVSQSRGAILFVLEQLGVAISEYTPLQVKQALTGYGRAEKKQVQQMVKTVLRLPSVPKPDDTADALAIALCHLSSRRINQHLN